jgi:uncharacterized protein (TIGR04222 family)
MSPFELSGSDYLRLYMLLLLGVVLVLYRVRKRLRRPDDEGNPQAFDLDPYAIALLAGKEDRAADAVIASLVGRNLLLFDAGARRLIRAYPPPAQASQLLAFERDVYDAIPETGQSLKRVYRQACQRAEVFRRDLLDRGLLCTKQQNVHWGLALLGLLGGVPLMGRLLLPQSAPLVGLLNLLLMLLAFSGLLAFPLPWRTLRGERVLQQLLRENASLQTTAWTDARQLHGRDAALALGLFGAGVLGLVELQALQSALTHIYYRPSSANGCGGGDSGVGGGDGGGDGGSCGGGGGGCGGGGCGGGCGGG